MPKLHPFPLHTEIQPGICTSLMFHRHRLNRSSSCPRFIHPYASDNIFTHTLSERLTPTPFNFSQNSPHKIPQSPTTKHNAPENLLFIFGKTRMQTRIALLKNNRDFTHHLVRIFKNSLKIRSYSIKFAR